MVGGDDKLVERETAGRGIRHTRRKAEDAIGDLSGTGLHGWSLQGAVVVRS